MTTVNQRVRASGAKRSNSKDALKIIIIMIFIIAAAVYFLIPIAWMLISSTKDTKDLFGTGIFAFGHFHLFQNIKILSTYSGGIYWRWYGNSIFYSGGAAILTCIVSASIGYALSKFDFRGKNLIFFIILSSMMVPGTIITIPLLILERPLGLVNTYMGLLLPLIVNPFGVYFLRIYITQVVENELLEACRVDGAREWTIFWKILLPVIRPAIGTLFLISFIGSWNNFFLPLVLLSNSNLFPVTVGIEYWTSLINTVAGNDVPWYPLIITASLLSVLPMIIGFTFLKNVIVNGMTQGSLKA